MAILAASDTFLQSINQNLADTVVVNDTQSLTNVRGVDPVTSSQIALFCPPSEKFAIRNLLKKIKFSIYAYRVNPKLILFLTMYRNR